MASLYYKENNHLSEIQTLDKEKKFVNKIQTKNQGKKSLDRVIQLDDDL
ncbi:MAG: hypothetical protein UU48_C0006G0090 [Candidatus Uhrbacteria bacterium GW2011_GWF2_41_16]|jgi:hypothetical protein|uniref:Uncharacterized protein n=2 Tax=Candidatus Uhriibacteriota TaxID=1752732 RepID=A0A0G0XMM3_9BACT|nr:MAG: hypothetical protein UU35_C0007G0042 [Candidatus Uhrbacteria bacterium GW2011_GWC2_41_11]KKR98050.1 MAG: hypothetical protein UU48_C0006G0090 [Candidatus Uhrbacteria bacterium GW2011_GWF2_41_16]